MLIKIAILFSIIAAYLCCSCMQPTIQGSYCRADLVARVKVSNRTEAADQHVYVTFEIETIEIFKKTTKSEMVAEKNVIYTGPQDGICAVVIDTTMKTADWIIFGHVRGRRTVIELCDANQEWNESVNSELQRLSKLKC